MSGTGGSAKKRVTRSVSEASAASDKPDESFEAFVRMSLTSMSSKMDSFLARQDALEERCNSMENRIAKTEGDINDVIQSIDFE